MKFLDIKGAKKVQHDDKTATLELPQGHTIHVMVKKLRPLQQEQLKKLPLHKGGKVKHYDGGGDITPQYDESGYPVNATAPMNPPAPPDPTKASAFSSVFKAKGGAIERHMYADQQAPVAVDDNAPIDADEPPTPAQTPQSPVGQYAGTPINVNLPPVQNTPMPMNNNGTANVPAGLNMYGQGANLLQQAQSGAAQAGVQNEVAKIKALGQIQNQVMANKQEIGKHVNDFAQYLQDNPYDESHFQHTMSTPNKIGSIFGMLAGGIKQGLIGGDNPGVTYFQQQIQNDLEGQKQRMGQQKTILGAYQQLYGDTNTALEAARASTIDVHAAQIAKIADEIGTPEAEAAKKMSLGQLMADKSDSINKASQNKALETSYSPQSIQPEGLQSPGVQQNKQVQPSTPTPQSPVPSANSAGPHINTPSDIWANKPSESAFKWDIPDKDIEDFHKTAKTLAVPILAKGSEKKLSSAALQNPTMTPEQVGSISTQHTRASQVDKLLQGTGHNDGLPEIYTNMMKLAKQGGMGGRFYRNFDPENMPGDNLVTGGAKIAAGLMHKMQDNVTNRDYNNLEHDLVGKIHQATGLNTDEVKAMVRSARPEYGDDIPAAMQKLQSLIGTIKQSAPTDVLSTQKGMLNGQQ
jgi:hypothetical protein